MRVSMFERLWGVNVSVNEIFVFSFLSCDYPLQRGERRGKKILSFLYVAKSWYEKNLVKSSRSRRVLFTLLQNAPQDTSIIDGDRQIFTTFGSVG